LPHHSFERATRLLAVTIGRQRQICSYERARVRQQEHKQQNR
jgi:hypothetical protein